MTARWVSSVDDLYDFIAVVVLRAPDQFPVHDFLGPAEQLNLDRAFEELRHGVVLVGRDFPDPELLARLGAILDESLALYRAGDVVGGAHRLQDFQDVVFTPSRP